MDSRKFADKMMPFLEKYNNYTDKEKIVAHYGLETLYILVTKMFLITIISLFFGITKEMYIFTFFYAFLRHYTGGMHLQSSIGCTLMSTIILIGGTYMCLNLNINKFYIFPFLILFIFLIYKFSPADTNKKPIINRNKRHYLKQCSCVVSIVYTLLYVIGNNSFFNNCLIISIFFNCLLINPITYKIFKQKYNNYLIYENLKRKEI